MLKNVLVRSEHFDEVSYLDETSRVDEFVLFVILETDGCHYEG